MKNAIILFVRNPELGKVKTRLAREIGDELTLKVYTQLLEHTYNITCNLACDKYVFYTDFISQTDLWNKKNYFKRLQTGNDLGDKMQQAFQTLFNTGYDKVIIIGSDCPGLTSQIIENAFELMNSAKVVLGPAVDGGYYLLGMTNMIEALFQNKHWSTSSVFNDSLDNLRQKDIKYAILPVLQDIDTKEDLVQLNYIVTE